MHPTRRRIFANTVGRVCKLDLIHRVLKCKQTEFNIKSVFIRYSLLFGNYLAGFQQRIKVFFCHKEEVNFDVETHLLFLRAESERLAAERLLEEAKSLIEVTNTYHSCPPTRSQMIRMRRSGWTRSKPRWT